MISREPSVRVLHGNLPGHGAIEACGYRMLQSPCDVDRSTAGVADVLEGPRKWCGAKNRGDGPSVLFRAYRPVRTIQCLPPCRVLAMPAACAHAGHVGTPAAFGVWRVMVWNAMVFE
jgi:hypothetical protein